MDHLEDIARVSKVEREIGHINAAHLVGMGGERDYIPMNFLAGIKKVAGRKREGTAFKLDEIQGIPYRA